MRKMKIYETDFEVSNCVSFNVIIHLIAVLLVHVVSSSPN